jgi:inner membrane transporter RhtA
MAVAISLIEDIGSDGTAWLRLAWAGLILLVVIRPRPSQFTWATFGTCLLLGAATAGISLLFMASLDYIPRWSFWARWRWRRGSAGRSTSC